MIELRAGVESIPVYSVLTSVIFSQLASPAFAASFTHYMVSNISLIVLGKQREKTDRSESNLRPFSTTFASNDAQIGEFGGSRRCGRLHRRG